MAADTIRPRRPDPVSYTHLKIRSWFKKERREENILEGREEIEREFKRNFISLPDDKMQEFLNDIAKRQHFYTLDDFMAAVGYGGISLSRIMPRIKDDYNRQYLSLIHI